MLFDPAYFEEAETGTVAHNLYRLIHDVYVLLDSADRDLLARFNLTPSQYRVLILLHPLDGRRLTDLSDRMLVARSTITRMIDQMEAAGWVHRIADPEDRRAQRVALTSTGSALRQRAYMAHEQSLFERIALLPENEQMQLIQLLKNLRAALRVNLGIQDA